MKLFNRSLSTILLITCFNTSIVNAMSSPWIGYEELNVFHDAFGGINYFVRPIFEVPPKPVDPEMIQRCVDCFVERCGIKSLLTEWKFYPRTYDLGDESCEGHLLPIAKAIQTNDPRILKMFLDKGISADAIANYDYCCSDTLLTIAVSGYLNSAKFLLERGANPNLKNSLRRSPMHIAANTRSSDVEMIKLLLKYQANPDVLDDKRQTALQIVLGKENKSDNDRQIIELLQNRQSIEALRQEERNIAVNSNVEKIPKINNCCVIQ